MAAPTDYVLIHLSFGNSQPAGKINSHGDDQGEAAPERKQKLQEEQKRNHFVEETYVKVVQDPSGPAGFIYHRLKCNRALSTKIRAIAHPGKCGKPNACKRRGKSRKRFSCNVCGHKETTKRAMIEHRRSAHKIKVRTRCTVSAQCCRYFSSYKALRYSFS